VVCLIKRLDAADERIDKDIEIRRGEIGGES
jgi:hypothetical protein